MYTKADRRDIGSDHECPFIKFEWQRGRRSETMPLCRVLFRVVAPLKMYDFLYGGSAAYFTVFFCRISTFPAAERCGGRGDATGRKHVISVRDEISRRLCAPPVARWQRYSAFSSGYGGRRMGRRLYDECRSAAGADALCRKAQDNCGDIVVTQLPQGDWGWRIPFGALCCAVIYASSSG